MSNITGVLRGGWHPKGKDGGRESWRGDFKGVNQVAGLIGKGKNTSTRSGSSGGSDHISRPLAALKDPAAFGPPPKNVNFHGGAALPNQTTPDRRGLGAPLPQPVVESAERAVRVGGELEAGPDVKPTGPRLPYRANRTGLKTDHLPPPPLHRAANADSGTAQETGIAQAPATQKPSLPPRLPPRSNCSGLTSSVANISPPPTYDSAVNEPKPAVNSYINQEAASGLGKAGISVPGLGIDQNQRTIPAEENHSASSPPPQFNELSSRFSRLNRTSTTPQPSSSPSSPAQGTTLAQKQSAIQTAQSFHKDPTSISATDAQTAANTANNFRERHQEHIAAGAQKAKSLNKKYNITGRMNSFLEQQSAPAQQQPQQQQPQPAPQAAAQVPSSIPTTPDLTNRKAPPPPPPKKPNTMHGQLMGVGGGQAPPPVPLGTKPSLG
ncbi:hypothetical protein EPUS_01016 [Endocarpon pusillum Z07020]|uniref:Uncharacterized protein n=1 Tax=Endocarpon pusillum (strain Z07020 / HMAS-L-300199) TaxID=1263415 RepID=U1HG13_ENDPU|nr:uncharacterized protein EPUS_01016 [Endocarpon pusillum Z07020]ERF69060.1 hypothetical protein EPUS_01016 [Endocarpon pusillum Z07020]